jgi:hypothetical protein
MGMSALFTPQALPVSYRRDDMGDEQDPEQDTRPGMESNPTMKPRLSATLHFELLSLRDPRFQAIQQRSADSR